MRGVRRRSLETTRDRENDIGASKWKKEGDVCVGGRGLLMDGPTLRTR